MGLPAEVTEASVHGAAESFSTRPVMANPPKPLRYANGFALSPYADIRPAGTSPKGGKPPGKLWHSSPGSSGG
jgi:error-prone DNA polymerase